MPGYNETEVSFYDRNTGLFFSGDFLLPGRLLIEDAKADLASAKKGRRIRQGSFAQPRPRRTHRTRRCRGDVSRAIPISSKRTCPGAVERRSARAARGPQQLQRILLQKRQVYPKQSGAQPHRRRRSFRSRAACVRADASSLYSAPQEPT